MKPRHHAANITIQIGASLCSLINRNLPLLFHQLLGCIGFTRYPSLAARRILSWKRTEVLRRALVDYEQVGQAKLLQAFAIRIELGSNSFRDEPTGLISMTQ